MHRLTLMAFALTCFVAASAQGQDEFYYSFTSGGAPTGDGFNWPKSQIAKQGTVGLDGAGFHTPNSPLTLHNFSGNPAYFDANNLLTRPASLISRQAWWTDPRWANYNQASGPVQSAGLTIQFQQADWGHTEVYQFGFDIAFASVSHALPLGLDFQITDTLGNIGFGYLSFASTSTPGSGIYRSSYSTFNTLGSVYGGKQARFRFDVEELLANNLDSPPGYDDMGEFGFYGLEYMDIRLRPLVTPNGTSQIAIDNFIINYAEVGAPPPQPEYIAPNFPLPDTTIYRFDYLDASEDDNKSYVDLGDKDLAAVSITSGTSDAPFSANTITSSTTVFFQNEPGFELASHEMSHTVQNNPPGPDNRVDVNAVTITVETQSGEAPAPFGVEVTSQISSGVTPDTSLIDSLGPEQQRTILDTLVEIQQAQHNAAISTIQNIGFSTMFSLFDVTPQAPDYQYYLNYSLLDYIDFKDELGEDWNVGDQGVTLAPVLGDDQEIVSYILTNWLITDESGTYVQSMAVPEPSSLALLGLGGLLSARRRR